MLRETSEDGADSAGEGLRLWLVLPARTTVVDPHKAAPEEPDTLSSSPFPQLSQFVSTEWRESQSKQIMLTPLSRWHLASEAGGTLPSSLLSRQLAPNRLGAGMLPAFEGSKAHSPFLCATE